MPGRLLQLTPDAALGWAAHPRLADYRVVVNMAHAATIACSVLAETPVPSEWSGSGPTPCGFRIDLAAVGVKAADIGKLRFWIGETDEPLDMPDGWSGPAGGRLTVEDLLGQAHRARSWVDGTTYVDAERAGLQVETIVDLLYRDYLGRSSDPNGLAHYSEAIRAGRLTYDDVRRGFLDADEFRMRRKYLDNAPGSIFSQRIVSAVAGEDPGLIVPFLTVQTVVASELAALDGADFVSAVYRTVLLKEADEGGMAHYLHQLHLGVGKMEVIRTIAGELEAITAGVRVIGYTPESASGGQA